jgi:steroid delta-isomerase-like uncharacterized protein
LKIDQEAAMSTEQNKKMAQTFIEEVLNTGDFVNLEAFFAPGYYDHAAIEGYPRDVEGVRRFFTELRSAFPNFRYKIDQLIAEDDRLVVRLTASGTMKGAFQGMPASGKSATWTEIHWLTLDTDSRYTEHWANVDQLGMLQQLGFASGQAGE